MSVEINGIAHIQFTINDPEVSLPFWESLCHFMGMETLIRNDETVYCIGGRTGLLARAAPAEKRGHTFDQWTTGLHHFCLRARSREDVDAIHAHAATKPSTNASARSVPTSCTRLRMVTSSRQATIPCCSKTRTESASRSTTSPAKGTSASRAGLARTVRGQPVATVKKAFRTEEALNDDQSAGTDRFSATGQAQREQLPPGRKPHAGA